MKPSILVTAPVAGMFLAAAAAAEDAPAIAANAALVTQAQQRWEESPHGAWLARILPPAVTAAELPQPASRGAALVARYCVQCHHLPSPAMHPARQWPKIVRRMVDRMQGRGNMGTLMKDMMGNVAAPSEEESHALLAYLQTHAQKAIEPRRYPDLAGAGRSFRDACGQCHALPDPRAKRRGEWREVVERMERNMQWMNRVVGSKPDPAEPQLEREEIVGYLERYARRR